MLLKHLASFSILALGLTVATSVKADTYNYTGPYAGAYATVIALDNYYDAEGMATAHNGEHSAGAGLLGGYGWNLNSWFLGGEGFIQANGHSDDSFTLATDDGNVSVDQLYIKQSFGAKIRAGYLIANRTLAFLSLGVISSKFKFTAIDEAGMAPASQTTTRSAPQIGLGLETAITEHLHLRTQYNYTQYGKIKQSAYLPGSGNINFYSEPKTSQFDLVLSYHF